MKKATILLFGLLMLTAAYSQQDSAQVIHVFLPLQVISFDAKEVNGNVQLSWTVNSSEDVKSFEIERADDGGIKYKTIGGKLSVGHSGTASYDFVDALPRKNIEFSYRIKIVTKDGIYVYSDFRPVRIEEDALKCKLLQNPVRQTIDLEVNAAQAGKMQAIVYTHTGQRMLTQTLKVSAGVSQLNISSQQLLPGLHRLVLGMGNERKVISFVKE